MVYENILQTIGNTPIVKLNQIGKDLACDLYAKCEFFNPGGSVKDRIGISMIEAAEKSGRIKPGDTLIEPTSGNTGIGIALAGAIKGYKVIIVMPEKMSQEKQVVLERLGAKIIRTPTEAAFDDPKGHIETAKRLEQELPNAYILDQYANPANPDAHYDGTAAEIIADMPDGFDMVVMGMGTGGTITGVAKRLKETWPNVTIVGVDPEGSIMAGGTEVDSYHVEGIGYDFLPKVFEPSVIDQFIKSNDVDSFRCARALIQKEGLLAGGSSGAALYGALQAAKDLPAGKKVLIILPDSIRNYLSKHANDQWLNDNGLAEALQEADT